MTQHWNRFVDDPQPPHLARFSTPIVVDIREEGDNMAMRALKAVASGIWNEIKQYPSNFGLARALCLGVLGMGVRHGDMTAIMGAGGVVGMSLLASTIKMLWPKNVPEDPAEEESVKPIR